MRAFAVSPRPWQLILQGGLISCHAMSETVLTAPLMPTSTSVERAALDATQAAATPDHRSRLMTAMGTTLVRKPYAEITIADVVAEARVSKRTFYEQFASKDECLLALCELLSERTLAVMSEGFDPDKDWLSQLNWVIEAYLGNIQKQPALIRTLCIELLNLGAPGLAVRRAILLRFVNFVIRQVELSRQHEPGRLPLSHNLAMAVVGGVNELILEAIEQGRGDRLLELAPEVTAFVKTVLDALEPHARSHGVR